MEARVFKGPETDEPSNPDTLCLCVDGKVHLTQTPVWHLDEELQPSSVEYEYWGELTPCDGSCIEKIQLPAEVEALVQRFLDTDGRECGEARIIPPRDPRLITSWEDLGSCGPDAPDDEDNE